MKEPSAGEREGLAPRMKEGNMKTRSEGMAEDEDTMRQEYDFLDLPRSGGQLMAFADVLLGESR